jgi:chaperonin GroEL
MTESKMIIDGMEAKKKLLAGVNTLANAVKHTLGPRGRHAAIERGYGPPLITKDGVTVARSIYLEDPIENMGAQLVKSVAASANATAGDGTTTATVLAQAIFTAGIRSVLSEQNPVLLKRGIDFGLKHLISALDDISINISDESSIRSVATISANNDEELGATIADTVSAVGEYGYIFVEESPGSKTNVKYFEGVRVDRGLLGTDFISNPSKLTCELEDAYILCYDAKIESIVDIKDIIDAALKEGKPILVIARDYSQEAVANVAYNRLTHNLNICVIKAPGFGDVRREMMRDICVATGARLLHNDHGMKLKSATLSDLGFAKKIVVGLNETSIVDGTGDKALIQERLDLINAQIKDADLHDYQKENLAVRISRLTGGVAILYVGGANESEVKEKKDRVEDAINAVRSALAEGVVAGGGAALFHAANIASEKIDRTNLLVEEVAGIKILFDAAKEPLKQILKNSGEEDMFYSICDFLKSNGPYSGYDALHRKFSTDLISYGVMDPKKVVRTALEHAASAAGTLLTTEVTISNKHPISDK